jgi:hypothetical protein
MPAGQRQIAELVAGLQRLPIQELEFRSRMWRAGHARECTRLLPPRVEPLPGRGSSRRARREVVVGPHEPVGAVAGDRAPLAFALRLQRAAALAQPRAATLGARHEPLRIKLQLDPVIAVALRLDGLLTLALQQLLKPFQGAESTPQEALIHFPSQVWRVRVPSSALCDESGHRSQMSRDIGPASEEPGHRPGSLFWLRQ